MLSNALMSCFTIEFFRLTELLNFYRILSVVGDNCVLIALCLEGETVLCSLCYLSVLCFIVF